MSVVRTAQEKVKMARSSMVLDHPFYGSMLLKMQLVEDNSQPTMATNIYSTHKKVMYNSEFVDNLSIEGVKAVLAHEVLHVAMAHALRREHRNYVKWNMAGDFAINLILQDGGFELPTGDQGGLIDEKYRDMTAEHIYSKLPDPKIIKIKFDSSGKSGGEGDDQKGNSPGGYSIVEVEGHQGCPCGGMRDPEGAEGQKLSQSERNALQSEIESMVAEAATVAKAAGKLPGSLEQLVDGLLEHRVDWREQLRHFFEIVTKNDYSWTVPNRRYVPAGMYLPSLHSHSIGTVVVAIDTSGSVSNEVLSLFASEISGMLDTVNLEKVIVLHCDTQIQNVEEYSKEDLPLQLNVKGRGGTMFSPVFDWIEENGVEPVCMVYQTDLYCNDFPNPPPEYPVLWVAADASEEDPPFGKVIRIDE